MQDRILKSREPWWAKPPAFGQDELTCEWGWLEIWSDGTFNFIHERPTDAEITQRKSCRIPDLRDADELLGIK